MNKSLVLVAAAVASFLPGTGLAASYTFNMNSNLLGSGNGLDHHNAYAWTISGFQLGSATITSAVLTFTNFSNWDNNPNRLFVYIGATASLQAGMGGSTLAGTYANTPAGFTQTTTYVQDSANGTTIADYFAAAGTSATALYDSNVGSATKTASSGHTFVTSVGCTATPCPAGFSLTPLATMSIDLGNTAGVLSDLRTYIGSASGGDFALLLDSDCHYFFSTAQLVITTSTVPEPGSIMLLLTVVAGVVLALRKKAAASHGPVAA